MPDVDQTEETTEKKASTKKEMVAMIFGEDKFYPTPDVLFANKGVPVDVEPAQVDRWIKRGGKRIDKLSKAELKEFKAKANDENGNAPEHKDASKEVESGAAAGESKSVEGASETGEKGTEADESKKAKHDKDEETEETKKSKAHGHAHGHKAAHGHSKKHR